MHYFYVGHFEHNDEGVRLRKHPTDGVLQPVVSRPVDPGLVQQVLTEITGDPDFIIPQNWGVWFDDGYLSCNPHTHEPRAIQLVAEIAKNDKCEGTCIADQSICTP